MTIRTTLIATGLIAASLISVLASGTAHAALQGRDLNGSPGSFEAYYDTDLDITWLADANLAASNTFGLAYNTDLGNHPSDSTGPSYSETIRTDGKMTWGAALHWIDAMNAANYLGYSAPAQHHRHRHGGLQLRLQRHRLRLQP